MSKQHKEKKVKPIIPRGYYGLYKRNESNGFTKALGLYFAVNSGKFSSELTKLVYNDDYSALLAFNIDYNSYSSDDLTDLRFARQCLSLYSKNADLKIRDVNPKRNCLMSFVETELKCRQTNLRLYNYIETKQDLFSVESDLTVLLRKISQILGQAPKIGDGTFSFGPGSAVIAGNQSIKTMREKLHSRPVCSSSLYMSSVINDVIESLPLYFTIHHVNDITIADGKYGQVAKNALTERTIETQPLLNLPIQKEVGSAIRSRLALFGCDLNTQNKNQSLALLGSETGAIVTVDVRNASNTVAIMAVYVLLYFCPDWFDLLWSLRSPTIQIHGHRYSLETFSTMGNGYTFELESLIFFAIALMVTEKVNGDVSLVSVYGDDIIVPIEAADELLSALSFFGFTVNSSKSYFDGPFRESCGKDYFLGENIRPFYCKDRWTDARIVALLNHDFRHYQLIGPEFRQWIIEQLDPVNRLFGPDGLGDGFIVESESFLRETVPCLSEQQHFVDWPDSGLDPFWYSNMPRKKRDLFNKSSKSGYFIYSISKTPMEDYGRLRIDGHFCEDFRTNQLYPAYICAQGHVSTNYVHWKTSVLRNGDRWIYRPMYRIESRDHEIHEFPEHDPYIVRGGWREKKSKIYILSL